jgi:NAD(P)-dependent dehydrogenase (short-subunit alcohol dehydrogenase family)
MEADRLRNVTSHVGRPVVVVTGSSGIIGSKVVEAFLERGSDVVGLDRVKPKSEPNTSPSLDATFTPVIVDTRSAQGVSDALKEVLPQGSVTHLVCIVGGSLPGEDGEDDDQGLPSPELFNESVSFNLNATYAVFYAALPFLRAAVGDRSVTFCSSINATGAWARPAYSAAKAGLGALARLLADRLGSEGIRVNVVAPGSVDTGNGVVGREHDAEIVTELIRSIPLGHAASPEVVARAFTAVALDLTHMTGHTLVLDGGQEVRRRR